jgi:hypothetical protein
MRGKIVFLAGLGIGYVLGSRAGRQRYEQIVQASRKFAENPKVQETADLIQAKTGTLVNTAKDLVESKLANTKIGEKVSCLLPNRDQTARKPVQPELPAAKAR